MSSPAYYPAVLQRVVDAVAGADQAVTQGLPADRYLSRVFRNNRAIGSRNRRLIGDTVFSFFRWRGWWVEAAQPLDYEAATLLAHLLDADTVHPAFEERMREKGWPLTGITVPLPTLPEEKAAVLRALGITPRFSSLSALFPDGTLESLAIPEDADAHAWRLRWMRALQTRPPIWLLMPARRRAEGVRHLQDAGYPVHADDRVPGAVRSEQTVSREHLLTTAPFPIELQDIASQCVGSIASPRPGETWWDLCAGAGGKTLSWLLHTEGQGTLYATEPRPQAVQECRTRLARHRTARHSIHLVQADARHWQPDELVDGILIDAPCSGWGMWGRTPDARWRSDPRALSEWTHLQAELLDHAARFVRGGGKLVYSVCTFTADETVRQIERFLEIHSEFEPVPITHPLTGHVSTGSTWIAPWEGPGGGMFIAALTQNKA